MMTQKLTPAKKFVLVAGGYLLIALAPTLLSDSPLSVLGSAILYGAFVLLLLKVAVPLASRSGNNEAVNHPVQAGKAPLLRRHYRVARGDA